MSNEELLKLFYSDKDKVKFNGEIYKIYQYNWLQKEFGLLGADNQEGDDFDIFWVSYKECEFIPE